MDPELLTLFAKAALVGLLIAAPVGPIGLLTIRRTLEQGRAAGLATGLGAACADALYGAVGAYGVSLVIEALLQARLPLGLGGGALLMWLAWKGWHAPLAEEAAAAPGGAQLLASFLGTFVLTLSNPATILSFLAVFASLAGDRQVQAPGLMVAGVWLGSAAWWLLLTALVGRIGHRLDNRWRLRIQRGSSWLLAGFALWQWGQLLQG
jgi:threonine/homoserine/homoserine lactone efflux protein